MQHELAWFSIASKRYNEIQQRTRLDQPHPGAGQNDNGLPAGRGNWFGKKREATESNGSRTKPREKREAILPSYGGKIFPRADAV